MYGSENVRVRLVVIELKSHRLQMKISAHQATLTDLIFANALLRFCYSLHSILVLLKSKSNWLWINHSAVWLSRVRWVIANFVVRDAQFLSFDCAGR